MTTRPSWLARMTLAAALATWTSPGSADEPFFRFLDDFSCGGCPHAQRDPYEQRIETDRHDFTQSTTTVGDGVFQIESGYTFFYKDHQEEIETSHTFPELLLRYGLSEDIEVRLKTNSVWQFVDGGDHRDGAEDLHFGLKLGMTERDGLIPESALELLMAVPTGGSAWSTEDVNAGVDFIYGWELSEEVTLYGSTGAFQNGLGDFGFAGEEPSADDFVVVSQSAALGIEITQCSTAYLEWYGLFSVERENEATVSFVDAGVDFYVTDNFVLDIRLGIGLTEDSDDLFAGFGGGYRF